MKEFKDLPNEADFDAEELELLEYLLEEEGVAAEPRNAIRPRRDDDEPPLSFAQQRLWLLDQLQPGSPAYNMPGALRMSGTLDAASLEKALNEVVRRHEVLRATFHSVSGRPAQVINPHRHAALPSLDLTAFDAERQAEEVRRLTSEEARRPFDLTAGPLVRATLLRLAADEHVLLVTMHHIVSDGWSINVFVRELAALYEAFTKGEPSPLAELEVQYADFAAWQREWLQGDVLEAQLEYWRGRLGGTLPVLQLPTDRPRPAVQTFRGATRPLKVSREVAEGLKGLARAEGATLYMTLLAAFQVLLARYTGQRDLLVGTPVAGRDRAETEDLIGFFVNTLVMRADLSGRPSFRATLGRVREAALGAYAHQDVPFEKLVEELQPERDRSRTPLFQVTFALQSEPMPAPEVGGMRWRAEELTGGVAKFDLTLEMEETPEGLYGIFEYNTDVFDDRTVGRMAGHFRTLLAAVVADPDREITDLELLTPEERRRLLVEWNDTARDFPRESTIQELFEAQAAATPEAVALVFEETQLTYGELNRRANRLAHGLRRLGVGPEVFVGVLMERSLELVVGLLGILKAGGAYVPLDPSYPQERLAFMLEDAGARVLLTQERLLELVPASAARALCLDGGDAAFAVESEENPEAQATADNSVYVIYTSGSTGRPKGVVLPHRGVVNCLMWMQHEFGLGAQDRVMLKASLSFDASVWELFWPLLVGAGVVVARPGGQQDGEYLARTMARHRVTMAHFVPSMLPLFLEARELDACESLRRVACGGEAMPPELMQRFHERHPAELHNFYGPTETSIGSIDWRCEFDSARPVVPIGRPISNTRVFILDENSQPVPVGVPGELHIGGVGLARGYLNRPGLTAEKFVPDPFSTEAGARLYRTGDLARWLPDGEIDFLGRIDHQVKVRGFRIELEEIEAVLGQHEAVGEALVLAREDVPGDKRLVAYVVAAREAREPAAAELRDFLKGRLPEYMVPSGFVLLDALPLTPSGKVDRKALPAPEASGHGAAGEYVAPRTPVEEVLAGIFAEVLRVGRAGSHDNFFDLGGHSLLAAQVVARVREVFGVELPLDRFFAAPNVAEIAEVVEEELRAGRVATAPPLRPVPREGNPPLSFAQQRLWFIDQLEPGNPVYNTPGAVRLKGRLNVVALEQALREVVRRHESLRTTFAVERGTPVQVIAETPDMRVPVTDLTGLAGDEREAEAHRLAALEARVPFDLSAGPLVRATLLRLGEDEHVLLFTLHHIISDGWSMGVLVREVAALYEAFTRGEQSPLAELEVQYADYAVWQREWLRGETLEAQLAYWRRQLAGVPPVLELPTDRPRPKVQSFRGTALPVELPAELSEALRVLARREGVTLFMVLLAAWQALLARYSNQEDIAVGSPIANRRVRELEDLIGFFANTLVLRTDLSGDPSFAELLGRVREVCLGAYAHQDVPFEMLVEELQPERSLSHTPLFQVLLVLQNTPGAELSLPGLSLTPMLPQSGTSKFDLMLFLEESAEGLGGVFEYNTDIFDEETARRLLGHFETLLRGVVADPARRVSALPLLGEGEARQLLYGWNDTAADFPRDLCVHELFERQAARTPDAPALIFGDERLTYRELNARAVGLARRLRALGTGPEVVVGVLLERSLEMMVGLLGVLKAGGAYLPLDPENPAERLAFMLEDAGARVLLTETRLAGLAHAAATPRVLCLDLEEDAGEVAREETPRRAPTPDNSVYVIYTSGSTGRPKGVVMPHRAAVNLVTFQRQSSGEAGRGATLQFAPLSFDVSFQETFSTWCAGGTLVLVSEETRRDAAELLNVLESGGVERLFLPFVALQQLAEVSCERGRVPAALRAVITAGEQLKITPHIERMFAGLRGCVLDNHYGPTETHLVSMWRLEGDPSRWPALPSIGRPIHNAQVYLLDGRLNPVPAGVSGELYVGGAQLARGYLNRPGLTAERFIPHPFSEEPGARLYRTGDVARWLADGRLEYVGRVDNQVKVRGFRVETGEVESVLKQHAAVRQAVVVAREDEAGRRRLVAYVVAGQAQTPLVAGLRSFLKERLPDYMVPSAFVVLDELPLTPSGKVDRKALPAPDDASAAGEYVVPRTPVEEVLAGIFAEVLKVGRVGVHDNFFDLGGHSLLATQLMSRVRETFKVEVALRRLFEQPTVAELAQTVEEHLRAGEDLSAPPLRPAPREGNPPLSFAQQRLWFLDRFEPGGHSYNLPAAVRIGGALDTSALSQSLNEIVRRHEVLRTTFDLIEGQPVQVVATGARLDLSAADLRGLPAHEREAEAKRLALAEARKPFDLTAGPLMRATLLRLGEDEHVLLLVMHHIISDGWSMGVLVREVAALYEAFTRGEQSPLAELEVQYADYAVWQREWLRGEALEAQLAYWRRQLAGVPPVLELPTDRPRPAVKTFKGGTLPVSLSAQLRDALQALSRREGVTLFMVLLAAWQALLARYSNQEDIAVGSPIANRNRAETENLVGFFVNTLVLRTDLSGDPSFTELLGRVREVCLGAYAHQDVPFEMLVEELQPERSLSRTPLFQVAFALQNVPMPSIELSGLRLRTIETESETAKFDLTLSMSEVPEGLVGTVEYNADLFDAATVERMTAHFGRLLEGAVADPTRPVSRYELLSAHERHQLLVEWNDTARDFPRDAVVHQLFEARAAATPEAVALVFEETELTYGELNRRANRLAHWLRRLGVGPEARVGVLMERSAEMIVAVLGTVKAGGAYVPLDPAWPAQRLHFILSSLNVECLLTQTAQLRAVHEVQWRLPLLRHTICLDAEGPAPGPEPFEREVVESFWDHIAERAVDEVTAGGFVSSYTGEPFGAGEVAEYRERVAGLAAPFLGPAARVLEIGCGSGLLMFELAPRCGRYVGLDPSAATQARNRRVAAGKGLKNLELVTGFAHEADELAAGPFDLVIIASTAQFFPGPSYFTRTIEKALGLLAPGGHILVADVMDARRKEEFRASLVAYQREHPEARTRTQLDGELYFDEDFFDDLRARLPELGAAGVLHRERGFANELGYRYDVLLRKRDRGEPEAAPHAAPRKNLWTTWHLREMPEADPAANVGGDNLAYVIFTSGSTGQPKGVMVRHTSVVNIIDWVNRTFGVGPADRLLFVTSLTFDLSVYDIFGTLAAGASLRVATRAELRDPQRLVEVLRRGGITFWDSAPATLQQLAPLFPRADAESRLRLVFLSGDWIPLRLPDEVRAAFPSAHVVSLGGATEATVWSNFFPIGRVEEHWASIPYGWPIQNVRYHVLDANLGPCPVGVPGQLYIGGVCLADGYADPALTAEKFIPDPFGSEAGARLYRTGDLARYRAGGEMEFLGRADNQVKVRGFRIELGEIEAALASHPLVREAAAAVQADGRDRRLVGYVVAQAGHAPTTSELRAHLRERLPEYMVPAAFVTLEAMPLTANGKLDRRRLPAPDAARPSLEEAFVAPQDEAERTICEVWREALGVERVGVNDNFFELGGHSLLMVRVHGRLRELLRSEVSIVDLFRYPTVRSLAAYIGGTRAGANAKGQGSERAAARREALSQRSRARR